LRIRIVVSFSSGLLGAHGSERGGLIGGKVAIRHLVSDRVGVSAYACGGFFRRFLVAGVLLVLLILVFGFIGGVIAVADRDRSTAFHLKPLSLCPVRADFLSNLLGGRILAQSADFRFL
jgi:hypothetical protein